MFCLMRALCLFALLTEQITGIQYKRIECTSSGLNSVSDINEDVCKELVNPMNCTHALLQNNSIKLIQSSDFEKYHILIFLNLDENEISYIPPDAFRDMILRTLRLNNNKFHTDRQDIMSKKIS